MADLTADERVYLDICPAVTDCPACVQRAAATVAVIDEHVAAVTTPVHSLMREWAKTAGFTTFSPQQAIAQQNLTHVLEELRKVVGREDKP